MVQKTSSNNAHQVDLLGGTYDSTSPQLGSATVYVTSARTLKVFETNVHSAAAVAITLPNVSEAAGMTYVISSSSTGTVVDNDESYGWSDVTLADGETFVFTSNGVSWARVKGGDTT